MPLLHIVKQWDTVLEPINGQHAPTTRHWLHLSALYHPQSKQKLEVFNKYLKQTLQKLCENDPNNWNKYIKQVLASYCVIPHLATAETPFFLVYGRDTNLPLCQLLEIMYWFLGDPESGHLDLESHHLALAIAKKTFDDNRFKHAQKKTHTTPYLILKLVKINNFNTDDSIFSCLYLALLALFHGQN